MSPLSLPSVVDYQPSAGLKEDLASNNLKNSPCTYQPIRLKISPGCPFECRGLGLWREHAFPSTFWSREQFRPPFDVGYLFFCEKRRWESSWTMPWLWPTSITKGVTKGGTAQKEAYCPRRRWCSDILRLLPDSPSALPDCRNLAEPFSKTTDKKLHKVLDHT